MKTLRRVKVEYHHEDGTWWAESADAPGWTAVADTLDELRQLTREGIHFFLNEEVLIEDGSTAELSEPVEAKAKWNVAKWNIGVLSNDAGPIWRPFPRIRAST